MLDRWNDKEAAAFENSVVDLRVYSSRLLGQDDSLVLHGGGNTSVKSTALDVFGRDVPAIYVKGSGWDLKSIEAPGFAPCKLEYLQQLASLETLSDSEMMRQLRLSLLDPQAPTPSVEAILHAIIPFRYVDHTHTDAVVALSNTSNGEAVIDEVFADDVLVLPYIMPGFVLARQVFDATRDIDWRAIRGIFLMHHGLFTFADEAKASYQAMIQLVNKAEDYLKKNNCWEMQQEGHYEANIRDCLVLAGMRKKVSVLAGRPMLASWQTDSFAVGFSSLTEVSRITRGGPVTPDHSIHTKIRPVIIEHNNAQDSVKSLDQYAKEYAAYFEANNPGHLTCLDPAPRYGVWKNRGLVCFGPNEKRLGVVRDICEHTIKAMQWGEALTGWQALPPEKLFEVEYWELEQAKLKNSSTAPAFEGKVVLVTGAASGIGQACVEMFAEAGACVIALDINQAIGSMYTDKRILGLVCDVTSDTALEEAIVKGVSSFGGLDAVVSNAGKFTPSETLEEMSDEHWQQSMALNLSSHMRLIRVAKPFLAQGLDPAVVIIASKNVPAPGPGAGAYSVAKAGLTQLGRIAAMELGGDAIRVNMLHPNAVFDTGVWDEETLRQRADHYGMSVTEYKTSNILSTEVSSADVARLALAMASNVFAKTTGAQVPVDGGNDRVI